MPSNSSNSESTKSPLVWIVILHWRGLEYTLKCVESVFKATYSNFRVLVVDNGSEGNDGIPITSKFPSVEILRLASNHGFAGGCNRGIEHAMKLGAEYIWLLNNDTQVAADALSVLVEVAAREKKAAILGGTVVESMAHDEKKVEAGVGKINFKKAKTSVAKTSGAPDVVSCEWVHGSNLLMRVEALRLVGTFDERYFLYFEDTELCQRMRDQGWTCLYVPRAELEHVGNASTSGKQKHWRSYYYIRNRFLFFDTYAKGSEKSLAMFSMFTHVLRHALVLPFRGDEGRDKLRAEWLGMNDFLNKKFGKAQCLDWCD